MKGRIFVLAAGVAWMCFAGCDDSSSSSAEVSLDASSQENGEGQEDVVADAQAEEAETAEETPLADAEAPLGEKDGAAEADVNSALASEDVAEGDAVADGEEAPELDGMDMVEEDASPADDGELDGMDMVEEDASPADDGLLTIAETAMANPELSILVEAATLTGLADPLSKADGNYTIFAPTDAAFQALPEGELDSLLGDTEALAQILLYHALFGTFWAEDLLGMDTAEVLTALTIELEEVDGALVLNGVAKVTTADIACSNGVIHIIDTVLTVPSP